MTETCAVKILIKSDRAIILWETHYTQDTKNVL
jgi:hypothetical protein